MRSKCKRQAALSGSGQGSVQVTWDNPGSSTILLNVPGPMSLACAWVCVGGGSDRTWLQSVSR
jgi:hypothetical protein